MLVLCSQSLSTTLRAKFRGFSQIWGPTFITEFCRGSCLLAKHIKQTVGIMNISQPTKELSWESRKKGEKKT